MSAAWEKGVCDEETAYKLKEYKRTAVPGNSRSQAVERREKKAEKTADIVSVGFRGAGHGAGENFRDNAVVICLKKNAYSPVYEKDPDGRHTKGDGNAVFLVHKNLLF